MFRASKFGSTKNPSDSHPIISHVVFHEFKPKSSIFLLWSRIQHMNHYYHFNFVFQISHRASSPPTFKTKTRSNFWPWNASHPFHPCYKNAREGEVSLPCPALRLGKVMWILKGIVFQRSLDWNMHIYVDCRGKLIIFISHGYDQLGKVQSKVLDTIDEKSDF